MSNAEILPIPTEGLYEALGQPEVIHEGGDVTYDFAQANMLLHTIRRHGRGVSSDRLLQFADADTPGGRIKQVQDFIWSVACDQEYAGQVSWQFPDDRQVVVSLDRSSNSADPAVRNTRAGSIDVPSHQHQPTRGEQPLFSIGRSGEILIPKRVLPEPVRKPRTQSPKPKPQPADTPHQTTVYDIMMENARKRGESDATDRAAHQRPTVPAPTAFATSQTVPEPPAGLSETLPEDPAVLTDSTQEVTAENIMPKPLHGAGLAAAVAAARGVCTANSVAPSESSKRSVPPQIRPQSELFMAAHAQNKTEEVALAENGLKVVKYGDEAHLFLGREHIPLPTSTLNILQVVTLLQGPVTRSKLLDTLTVVLRQPLRAASLQNHLDYLDEVLKDKDVFVKASLGNPGNRYTAYRVRGALPQHPSRWPAFWRNAQPRLLQSGLLRLVS